MLWLLRQSISWSSSSCGKGPAGSNWRPLSIGAFLWVLVFMVPWHGCSRAKKYADNPVGGWSANRIFDGVTLRRPVYLVEKGDQFYILEQTGRILRFNKNTGSNLVSFLDVRDRTSFGQRAEGARSFAFHPKYDRQKSAFPFLYLYAQTIREGQRYDRLSRFRVDLENDVVFKDSELVLIEQEVSGGGHRGGHILFGPDGFLYLSLGDKDDANMHFFQNQIITNSLFSGIVRIDVDKLGGEISHPIRKQPLKGKTQEYYIPNDNPFVGYPDALEEFWSIGLREPFRMDFDRLTKQLWVGEVGEITSEEINIASKGSNHQWQYAEGFKVDSQRKRKLENQSALKPRHCTY